MFILKILSLPHTKIFIIMRSETISQCIMGRRISLLERLCTVTCSSAKVVVVMSRENGLERDPERMATIRMEFVMKNQCFQF